MSEQKNAFQEFPRRKIMIIFTQVFLVFVVLMHCVISFGGNNDQVFPGADEHTPSRAHFFDWLSSQYEGTTEAQTLTYMDFFKWMHDEFGMALDIYSLDVGNIDDGPYTAGVGRLIPYHYGTMETEEFKDQFPHGFDPLVKKAASFGCRLGIWLGPDGFGNTPEEEKKRSDMLIKFCRDYNFIMFKIDAVAGQLREEKQDEVIRILKECRKYCPDLIVLSERVRFGKATPYVTTSLWRGDETYIDVFMNNNQTAPHHRAGSLSRDLTPGLTRLIEDHGVCFNTCLDYWEDELVLQAFNRCLILAPQIYGTPWFLKDEEFPKMARLYSLHRRYRDILVNGIVLPEEQYGPYAVSRGDVNTRLITLRNLSWDSRTYQIDLDNRIGLERKTKVNIRRLHPSECVLGDFNWGDKVDIEVLPFRTSLILVSTQQIDEFGVHGCDYEIVCDKPGKPLIVKLLAMPGSKAKVRLSKGDRNFKSAKLDGVKQKDLYKGKEIRVKFPGKSLKKQWHRKIGELKPCNVPLDAEALYEATCFAADNNALEVRAVQRSGPSNIPQVIAARDAFFEKKMFINRAIWDKNLFDSNINTFFIARFDKRALRVDFGEPVFMDKLVIRIRDRQERDLNPALHTFDEDAVAQVSADMKTWTPLDLGCRGIGTIAIAIVPSDLQVRYLRIHGAPQRIAEVEAYLKGAKLDRSKWRASNLFESYSTKPVVAAWTLSFTPTEVAQNSYLAVAINGHHGNEGAYSALRVDGELHGAPDRSVSFPSNTWEYYNVEMDSNYTYYFPLSKSMVGEKIEVFVLIHKGGFNEVRPEAWITAYPIPYASRELILFEN